MNNYSFLFLCHSLLIGLLACSTSCRTGTTSVSSSEDSASSSSMVVWVATSHDSLPTGLRSFSMDPTTGKLELIASNNQLPKVSFFDLTPDGTGLYAVYMKEGQGTIGGFEMASKGTLRWLGELATETKGPCHISSADGGQQMLVAYYSGSSIQRLVLDPQGKPASLAQEIRHEGSSVNPQRQERAHPHMIVSTPNQKYVFVPDLGTDQLMSYSWDNGQLVPSKVPFVRFAPGSGPRHVDIHQELRIAYVLDELSAQVTSVQLAEDYGLMDTLASYPLLPADFTAFNKSSDIHLTPDGRFLYAANRGHNSLTIFQVQADGRLTLVGREPSRGKFPRNFAISPDGQFLVLGNRNSDNLLVFRIDDQSGQLTLLHEYHDLPGILCIKFQQVS
ncbi:MAG: lactonase family protein [Bacteroidota bacterium]